MCDGEITKYKCNKYIIVGTWKYDKYNNYNDDGT